MAISETGKLTHNIQIVEPNSDSHLDENGDRVSQDKIIVDTWAMIRTMSASDVAADVASLKNSRQYVIRHRFSDMSQVTTDMELIDNGRHFVIDAYNTDDVYRQWDVIIVHKEAVDNVI